MNKQNKLRNAENRIGVTRGEGEYRENEESQGGQIYS